MRKLISLQIVIIAMAILIVFFLVMSNNPTTLTGSKRVYDTAVIFVYLQCGQTIAGYVDYSGHTYGHWFQISDPNDNTLTDLNSNGVLFGGEGGHRTFQFTAKVSGQWAMAIVDHDKPYTGDLLYSYTISPSPILGTSPVALIIISIIISAVLEIVIYLKRTKKQIR